jgi:hypothetical protein
MSARALSSVGRATALEKVQSYTTYRDETSALTFNGYMENTTVVIQSQGLKTLDSGSNPDSPTSEGEWCK